MHIPATYRARLAAVLLAPLLLSACASGVRVPAPLPATDLFSDAAFKPPSAPVGAEGLFDLSPAMREYLKSPGFMLQVRGKDARHGLVNALYQAGELKLEYESSRTRNAAETFAAKSGNCLSLVIMTAAFARELRLPVQFQNVMVERSWSRSGDLYVGSTHVNLMLSERLPDFMRSHETARATLTVDFLRPRDTGSFTTHPLEERDIVAMYLNNRAAETLSQGKLDDAYWWAREAVKHNPSFINGYNTLAVVYQRRGDMALAARVFAAALEREPENTVIMGNLVPVLEALGKHAQSKALKARLDAIDPTPPFFYFNKGMTAMEGGDYDSARTLFAKEVRRAPYNDEFHFWLAIAHWRLGDGRRAHDELRAALDTSTTSVATQRYSAKLNLLRGGVPERKRLY